MKICCSQEHYDKVVQYAKSINDKTLENCLERLKQWEKNENRHITDPVLCISIS